MLKRLGVLFVVLILLNGCMSANAATNDSVEICADAYVASCGTFLSSTGNAQMIITLKYEANSVYISNCSLQIKENGKWIFEEKLPTPQTVGSNTASYMTEYDYSSYLTSGGTYRIVVVYNIDGYTKSYTSNSISY